MKHKISLKNIKGVSNTLFIPLRGRYLETKRDDGIVDDPKSIEIIDSIEHDFSELELPWVVQVMVSVRTEIFDEATKKFLIQHPDSVIVNLGCGLDTRVHRVDNGLVLWYDIDLPECIKLREKFFKQTDRFKFIAKSVLDFSWVDEIVKDKSTLFIAEGLFNYLREEDIKSVFSTIKDNFPYSEIVFEAHSSLITRSWHRHPHIKRAFSMFQWGLDTGKSLEKWDKDITFLQEWYYLSRHPKRWKWMRFFKYIRPLRRLMKIVHLEFNNSSNCSK